MVVFTLWFDIILSLSLSLSGPGLVQTHGKMYTLTMQKTKFCCFCLKPAPLFACLALWRSASSTARACAATLLAIIVRGTEPGRLDQERAKLARVLAERVAVAAGGVAPPARPRHVNERQGAPGRRHCGTGRPLALHAGTRTRLLGLAFGGGRQAAAQPFAADGASPFRGPTGLGALHTHG